MNCNEDYSEAQWNYDKYFVKLVDDVIEDFRNPLGLEWWDELDKKGVNKNKNRIFNYYGLLIYY